MSQVEYYFEISFFALFLFKIMISTHLANDAVMSPSGGREMGH